MAVPITALQITSSAVNSDAEYKRVEGKADGKFADGFYLWVKRGDGDPITGLAITHDNNSPGDGYVKIDTNLSKAQGKVVFLWYQLKGTGSPIVELKFITSDDASVGPGFNRISEELNPDVAGVKEYLTYKTKAAQAKLDARDFKVGDLVDCVDTSNAWLVARIVAVDAKEDRVQIHFEGWDPRWDEWLSRRSPRIAVHGSHTGGKWTGNRASREPWVYATDAANFAAVIKRVEAIVAICEAKVKELGPKLAEAKDEKSRAAVASSLALSVVIPRDEYTFLLQENSQYTMKVLNATLDDYKTQAVHTQRFLELQIKLIVHALKFEPELHVALQNIFLLFMCADPLFQKYYADYGRSADDKIDPPLPFTYRIQFDADNPRSLVSNLLCNTINCFGANGGFEAAQHRLHHPERYRDTFFGTAKIIQALAGPRNLLSPEWRKPYFLGLKLPELVADRLAKVTDDDLKTLDKDQLSLLSINVQNMLYLVLETPKLMEFVEKTNLSVALRLLNSGILAKRLDAVALLETALASIKPRDDRAVHAPGGAYYAAPQVQPAHYLTPAIMVNWLTENKVLDLLLGRDSHEQVIKRAPPVLKFLAQQNALKPNHLTLLWSAGVGKTDAVVRIVYDALADLSQELSEEHLNELFRKIQEKKLAEYRDYDLKFVRDFTVGAVHQTKPEKTGKWYGLDIFWSILQSTEALPPNIVQQASGFLTNLLAQPQFAPQLAVYLDKCIKTLHTGNAAAVLQALRLAQLIIDVAAPDQATKGKHSKEEVIAKLEKDHKLLASLLADVGRYRAEASKALGGDVKSAPAGASAAQAAGAGAGAGADAKDPLVGGHAHSTHVQVRFDFLEFILAHTAGELKLDQKFVDTLWDAYVTHPLHPTDRARCLAWLSRAVVKQDRKGKSILASLSAYIFNQLLCNEQKLPFASLPLDGWTCFETFFVQLNHMEDAVIASARVAPVVINYGKLVGLDALWSIATKATVPAVLAAASTLMTTLHIRLDWALAAKEKKAIFKLFVDKCMGQIKDSFAQVKKLRGGANAAAGADKALEAALVHRISQLLTIMDEYLTRMHNNELIGRPRFAEGMKIHATWMKQNQKYHAEVKRVNRDGTYVVLYADGDQDDFCPERNMYFPDPAMEKARDAKNNPEDDYAGLSGTPRTLLSNDQHYFDLLFDLLGAGGDVARLVVKLLAQLPVNQGLSDTIRNLATAQSVDWNTLLPRDSVMKLSYTLRIVRKQVIPPPLPQVPVAEGGAPDVTAAARQAAILAPYTTWSEMFLAKGGFVHLANIFVGTKIDELLATSLTQECLFHVLELINYFIATPALSPKANPLFDHEKTVKHLLPTLEGIVTLPPADQKLTPEQRKARLNKDGIDPIAEQEKQTFAHLVQYALHAVMQCAIHKPALLDTVIFSGAAGQSWDKILFHGLLHKSPYVRKAMATGLAALCGFPQAHSALLPKLLGVIDNLECMAHAAICSEYFDITSAELKRPLNAPAPPAAAAAAGPVVPASPQAAVAVAAAASDAKSAPKAPVYNAAKLVDNLCRLIRAQPVLEPSPGYIDYMLIGLMTLAEQLVQQNPELKEPLGKTGLIADLLLCLFDAPKTGRTPGVLPPPKCKHPNTRKAAYTLLGALADGVAVNRRKVLDAVAPYHQFTHSGLYRSDEWAFEARAEEKSNTGYLGLVNLACICYQNSNLQQLFMVPKFRASILAVDEYKETDLKESMVHQLQRLFGQLQEAEKVAANPKDFVHTYKGDDGKPVDVRVQEDSGEFLRKVLDRLSTGLKGTKYANAVKDVFGGVLVNQKIGRGPCTHYKERDEEFFGVQIQVKDKKTLEEGLAQFVAGDVMEGNDSVRCDACAKKVPVLMRQVFKRLPPTMIFVLKRFEMDYNTMDITKLNSKMTFPTKLSLRPYCQETLVLPKGHTPVDAAAAKPADNKSAPGTTGTAGTAGTAPGTAPGTPPATPPAKEAPAGPLHPDEYYEYVLRGVVIHTGSAHGGHYYSFIQERLEGDQEGKWYEFNDTRVSPFNPEHIPEECFGGSEEVGAGRRGGVGATGGTSYPGIGSDGTSTTGGYERMRNAYILYYDRVKPKPVQIEAPNTDKSGNPPSPAAENKSVASLKTMKHAAGVMRVVAKQRKAARALRARAQLQPQMFKEIWKTNQTTWRDRAVFDKVYFDFLWQVFDKVPLKPEAKDAKAADKVALVLPPTDPAQVPDHVAAAMLGTRFALMTLAHAKDGKDFLNSFVVRLRRLYESDISICLWLLQEMFNPDTMWACDYLLACPEESVRNNVADIICKIISIVSPHEQAALKPGAAEVKQEKATAKNAAGEEVSTLREVRTAAGHVTRFIDNLIGRLWTLAPLHWKTFDPYFRVLSHFASLGPAETAYLAREHNMLARVLDMFVGEKSSHPEVNAFASDRKGRVVRVGEDYGRPSDLGHVMVLMKQLVCSTQPPSAADAAAAPAPPVVDAKAVPLVIALDAKDAKPAAAAPLPTALCNPLLPLSKAASDLLLGTGKGEFLAKLVATAWSNRRGKIAAAIVAHLCWENGAASALVGRIVHNGLFENDYDNIRTYFRVLMKLVTLQDSLHVPRANALTDQLVTLVHHQSRYWKFTDFCLEHLIRMARKSPTVSAWLVAHQQYCDNMIGWLQHYQEPPAPSFHRGAQADDQTVQLLKPQSEQPRVPPRGLADPLGALDLQMRGAMQRRGLYGAAGGGVYGAYGVDPAEQAARDRAAQLPTGLHPLKKVEVLQVIKSGKAVDGPNAQTVADAGVASDSDPDLNERRFAVGDYIDCSDSIGKWLVAQVVRVDGYRIEIHYCGWATKWNETVDVADSRLRPLGHRTTREQHVAAGVPLPGAGAAAGAAAAPAPAAAAGAGAGAAPAAAAAGAGAGAAPAAAAKPAA